MKTTVVGARCNGYLQVEARDSLNSGYWELVTHATSCNTLQIHAGLLLPTGEPGVAKLASKWPGIIHPYISCQDVTVKGQPVIAQLG